MNLHDRISLAIGKRPPRAIAWVVGGLLNATLLLIVAIIIAPHAQSYVDVWLERNLPILAPFNITSWIIGYVSAMTVWMTYQQAVQKREKLLGIPASPPAAFAELTSAHQFRIMILVGMVGAIVLVATYIRSS